MLRFGTSHFVSRAAAIRYYRPYGYEDAAATIDRKIAEGEIHVGPPTLKDGQVLEVIDNGTRYAIVENQRVSLYVAITAAGIKTANHESDLYFPVTPESTEILKRYPIQKGNATTFTNRVEGGRWYDVPFAFEPWWEQRVNKGETK